MDSALRHARHCRRSCACGATRPRYVRTVFCANLGCMLAIPCRWFNKDPFELLQQNPNLLNDIEEATLPADPTYGEPQERLSSPFYHQQALLLF